MSTKAERAEEAKEEKRQEVREERKEAAKEERAEQRREEKAEIKREEKVETARIEQGKIDAVREEKERMETVRFYRTTDVVRLFQGVIVLTENQVSGREQNLDILGNGKFNIKKEVTFKKGEVIGLFGGVPKVYAEMLKPVEE